MAVRDAYPKARISSSHYFLTLSRGDNMRCFALRPWALFTIAGLFPLVGMLYFGASLAFILRDDMVAALYDRQREMQSAYEDRLAQMRSQLDKVTSRQLLDQNSLEGKMHDLISRQVKLESRSAVVAYLARGVTAAAATTGTKGKRASVPLPVPRPKSFASNAGKKQTVATRQDGDNGTGMDRSLPTGAIGFAPLEKGYSPAARAIGAGMGNKPRPGGVEIVNEGTRQKGAALETPAGETYQNLPAPVRLAVLAGALDRIEIDQIRKVNAIGAAAKRKADRLRKVIAATGIRAASLKVPKAARSATGGPFVPLKMDPDGPTFEREVLRLQKYIVAAHRLRQTIRFLPVRDPMRGTAAISSHFGTRIDPINGRMASHTGMDFRASYGKPVRSAGAGKVIDAGRRGGYGIMVEIDHGNGVTTRYAHLSRALVKEGDLVKEGTLIGRVGSTGRSTGPHLHYEVRLNGRAVNPHRFIRAGRKLASS